MGFFDFFSLGALALFLAVFIARSIMLARRGVRVFVIGAGKTGIRAALELGAMVMLGLFIVNIVLSAFHVRVPLAAWSSPFFASASAALVGAVLVAGGLFIFVWGLISFGSSWRIGIDKDKPGALVTRGAFGVLRNPVFVFMDLYFVGMFLVYPTWPFLVLALVFVAGVHFHILEEERFLLSAYGGEYEAYCRRVKRYGPF